jgi:hypothetical protein
MSRLILSTDNYFRARLELGEALSEAGLLGKNEAYDIDKVANIVIIWLNGMKVEVTEQEFLVDPIAAIKQHIPEEEDELDFESIILSEITPTFRELFVEGSKDQVFLRLQEPCTWWNCKKHRWEEAEDKNHAGIFTVSTERMHASRVQTMQAMQKVIDGIRRPASVAFSEKITCVTTQGVKFYWDPVEHISQVWMDVVVLLGNWASSEKPGVLLEKIGCG